MIFWDRTPTGSPFTISMAHLRTFDVNFQTRLLNEIEGLIRKNPSQKNLDVIASCDFDHVSNVFNVSLDGIKDAHFQSPSELLANCKVSLRAMDEATPEDLQKLLKFSRDKYSRKLNIQISDFLALHIAICFQTNIPEVESCLLDITLIHPMHEFALRPISQLNLANCALLKNHGGMSGFLMLSSEGQVVPMRRSAKNISSAPLVGVWITGVSEVNDVIVWATLLQYASNQNLQNRICKPPDSFVLLFCSRHSPFLNFFECKLTRCQPHSSFLIGQANVQLKKNFNKLPNSSVSVRMNCPPLGSKKHSLFQSLMDTGQEILHRHPIPVKDKKDVSGVAHVMPRPALPSKEREFPLITSSVPEMTLLSDDPPPGAKLLKGHTNHETSRTSTPNFHVVSFPGPKSSLSSSLPLNNLGNQLVRNVHGREDSHPNNGGRESKQNLMHSKNLNKMTIANRLAATNQRGTEKPVLNQNRDIPLGKLNAFINSPHQVHNYAATSSQALIQNKVANCSPVGQQYKCPLVKSSDAPHHLPRPNFSEKMPQILSDKFRSTSTRPLAACNQGAYPPDSYEGIHKYNPSTKTVPLAVKQVSPNPPKSSTSNSPKPSDSADSGFQLSSPLDKSYSNSNSMYFKQLFEIVVPALKKRLDSCSAISEEMPSSVSNTSVAGVSESDRRKGMGRIKDQSSGGSFTQNPNNSHPLIPFSNFNGERTCSDALSHLSHDLTLDYPSFSSKMEDISDYSSGNQTVFQGPQEIGSNYHAIYKGVQRLIASISHSESLKSDDNSNQNPKNHGRFYLPDEDCGSYSAEDFSEEESCDEYKNDNLEVVRKFLENIGVDASLDESEGKKMLEDMTQFFDSLDGDLKSRRPSDRTICYEGFACNYLEAETKSKKKKPSRVPSEASIYFHSYENNYITEDDLPYMKNVRKGIPDKTNRAANGIFWSAGQQDKQNVLDQSNKSSQNIGQLHYGTSVLSHRDTRRNQQQIKSHSRPT